MRDLFITAVILGSLPAVFFRPYLGVLVWSWIAYMNPHRLTWGFAYDFPFAQLVGITTLAGLAFTKDRRGVPFSGTVFVWVFLILWMNFTTLFALNAVEAYLEWDRAMKIQLFSFVTIMLVHTKKQIEIFVWVIALSLGFYGTKGGIFAFTTGAEYMVYGPPGSFIGDNTSVAVALLMVIPLLRYLQTRATSKLLWFGMLLALGLTTLAILSTQSRGALVGLVVMLVFFVWKSPGRPWIVLTLPLAVPLVWSFMPETWYERMATIMEYQQDGSAMGRINAWWFSWNLALDRPFVGGGFSTYTPELFRTYAPDPEDFHGPHSIYFQMLGEHGFVGLGLFVLLGFLAFRTGSSVIRMAKRKKQTVWAKDLAAMVQVSVVGYAASCAFLGLGYFDLYYHMVALLVILRRYVLEEDRIADSGNEDIPTAAGGETLAGAG